MSSGFTRRAAISALFGSCAGVAAQQVRRKAARSLPQVGEFTRFLDPLTENIVVRLTHPSFDSYLPAPINRFISAKERFLIFSSSRFGRLAPCELDLHMGRSRPLGTAENLVPRSLCLDQRERSLYLIDNTALKEIALLRMKERVVANDLTAFALEGGYPPRIVGLDHGRLKSLESNQAFAGDVSVPEIAMRPGGEGCFFVRELRGNEREFWYAPLSSAAKPVLLAHGNIWNPIWNPDGQSLLFLRGIENNGVATSEIREVPMGAGADGTSERLVVRTSQFASFAPNGNGSVFVGASSSKAQPAIVLLLRSVGREMTLCEHRAKNARQVCPVFSPDSRRIYFQSDREGKSVLYAVNVEQLVEPTL